jgi:hypothetical protein
LRVEIPKADGGMRPLGIPTVADRVAQEVARRYLEPILEPVFHTDSYGYRPGKSAIDAVGKARERCWRYDWVLDLDIKGFLDPVSYCTQVHESWLKRSDCEHLSLRRRPFLRPRLTWMASISPRLTRCHTVCRETPSRRMV